MKSVGEGALPATSGQSWELARPQVSTLETPSVGVAGETGNGVSAEPAGPGGQARGALAHLVCAKLLQSCLTLCDRRDCIPPGSSVCEFLQARILQWVAMPSSGGSSQPTDQTHVSYIHLHWQAASLLLAPPGKHVLTPPSSTLCFIPPMRAPLGHVLPP